MDVKKFSVYTVLGSLPWCFGLAYVGVLLGPHWSDLEALFRYLDIVVIAGIIGLVGYLIYHRKRIVSRMRS
jgi:membrane protein DedA with SNARE-associated domain